MFLLITNNIAFKRKLFKKKNLGIAVILIIILANVGCGLVENENNYIQKFGLEFKTMQESEKVAISGIWAGKEYAGSRYHIAWDGIEDDLFIIVDDKWGAGWDGEKDANYYSCKCKINDSDEILSYFSGLSEEWNDEEGELIYVQMNEEKNIELQDEVLLFLTNDGGIIKEQMDSYGYYEKIGEITAVERNSYCAEGTPNMEGLFSEHDGVKNYYDQLVKGEIESLRKLDEDEERKLYGYWVSEDQESIQIFNEKVWIRDSSSFYTPIYYKDDSMTEEGDAIMVVQHIEERENYRSTAYVVLIVKGDEMYVFGVSGFTRYIKAGEVVIY